MIRKKVNYQNGRPNRIHIGIPDRTRYFDIQIRNIILIFNSKEYYCHLTDSFFNKCPHLNGAYDNLNMNPRGQNRLITWLADNHIEYVDIKVVEPYSVFAISIHE